MIKPRPKTPGQGALVKLRPTVETTAGSSQTITETWTGPYDALETKQQSVAATAASTRLQPTTADHGELTITWEPDPIEVDTGSDPPTAPIIELIWQDLTRPIQEHPHFKSLTPAEKKACQDAAETLTKSGDEPQPPDNASGLQIELWEHLARGTTEYNIGVPVIRRTTERATGMPTATWVRSTPPTSAPGSWEYLKTMDEIRIQGRSRTRVEEWTGAEEWDSVLYPAKTP